MPINMTNIEVRLNGIRPLMFDRYAGDNDTNLSVEEKMYLADNRQLIMPALNVLSLLAAENGKSVAKVFFGKNWRNIALGISSYTNVEPFEIPILDSNGPIHFQGFNAQIFRHKSVARLAKGIPNPKDRPCLVLPWHIEFDIEYQENKLCTLENLRSAITMGGTLGLGTFRPYFGRYELVGWEEK